MLIGREGQNFYRIIRNVKKVGCKKEVVLNLMKEKKKLNLPQLYGLFGVFFFQIDSSLNLQIIRSDVSANRGIILWSEENIDDEKFKEAESVVSFLYGVKY